MAEAEKEQATGAVSAEANTDTPADQESGQSAAKGQTEVESEHHDPAFESMRAELDAARAELQAARSEAREYLSRVARVQADWDNFRKRTQRENEETARYANLSLVRTLLPVLDNLERALEAARGEGASLESLQEGVALISRQFHEGLARVGVEPVPGVGEPFNPEYHEAVMQIEGDQPGETVVEEFQKGYRMGDRLVRPSMVKVAKK